MIEKTKGSPDDGYYELCVFFTIEKNHQKLMEGSFIVTPTNSISCFGENHPVEFAYDKDHKYMTGIYKGLVINHVLGKESATLSLTMLDVKPNESSPFEVKQVVLLTAGMEMGIFSGSKVQESIMLDSEHVFLFQTILVKKRKVSPSSSNSNR
jgi:hypothetical protein